MLFAHDTEMGLASAAALVNTAHDEPDALPHLVALDGFLEHWGWTGGRTHDEAELDAVRALRPRLELLWSGDEDVVVAVVNDLLRDHHALPQLLRHDGWPYHLHATAPDAPLAARMAVEAAMAITDVVRMRERDRLRVCAAAGCSHVMVDLSKNRSRRFCDISCANRTNVAAYRARRAER